MKIEKITECLSKKLFNKLQFRKVISAFLCFMFLMQQTALLPVLASNITGIDPKVPGGNVYDINGQTFSGTTQFRQYNNFNLSEGDIANLIYKLGYDKFVNFVNNQVNINGILNTMRDNNFFNGHAIFVSPNGMVIGASGVLNVGALSVLTPSTDSFNIMKSKYGVDGAAVQSVINSDLAGLAADSSGKITINGKIFSRGDVELYGSDIEIGDAGTSKNSTGIFAGVNSNRNDANKLMASQDDAQKLFTALVKSSAVPGTDFGYVDGKIVIKAQAEGDFEDAVAKVSVNNATISGKSIDISAVSTSDYTYSQNESNLGLIPGVLDTFIDNLLDGLISGDFDDIFDLYNGPVSSAVVEILNSDLKAVGDIKLSSSATSNLEIPTPKTNAHPQFKLLYAFTTDTESRVNVKNSNIDTKGDVKINAYSENTMAVDLYDRENNEGNVKVLLGATLTKALTEASVDSKSAINAKNITLNALNNTDLSVALSVDAKYSDDNTIPASVGLVGVMNNTDIDTKASLDGTVTATQDINLNAQTLYLASVQANSTAKGQEAGEEKPNSEATSEQKGLMSKLTGFFNGANSSKDQASGGNEDLVVSVSGVAVYNNSSLSTVAEIGNNAVINANNLTLNANTIDLTTNQAIAGSDNAKFAPGAAVIVNIQNDITKALIKDGTATQGAKITLNGDLKLNATNQMPLNTASLEFLGEVWGLLKKPFTEDGFWDSDQFVDSITQYVKDINSAQLAIKDDNWTDTFGVPGFFNNYAQSSGGGESLGIAGSVIYSDVVNSTVARIGDYTNVVKVNNVELNAANDVIYTNLAGVFEELLKFGEGVSGKVGIGGSLIIGFNEHNALTQIGDGVSITANNNLDMSSATKQLHLNIAAGGGTAEKATVMGSVAVIEAGGRTESSIGRAIINATSLNINAGKAKIQNAKRDNFFDGYGISGFDSEKGLIALNAAEGIDDSIMFITVTGTYAKQEAEGGQGGGQGGSSGAAVGASVGVNMSNKEVLATIADGAKIDYKKKFNLNADTSTTAINVAIAGAFAGGVSAAKDNNATNDNTTSNGNQKTSNQGGWMDKIQGILDAITGTTDSTTADTKAATGSDVKGELAGGETQGALKDTGKDQTGNDTQGSGTLGDKLTGSDNLAGGSDTADAKTATDNISVAAAGSVNATITNNNVEATIGSATITKTGTDTADGLNISANQDAMFVNVAGGIGKAGTVGAGAALNFDYNGNSTIAGSSGTITLNGSDLNINANELERSIGVAVGVGAAAQSGQGGQGGQGGTKAAIGGSFNASVVNNEVLSYLDGTVKGAKNINVKADNKTQLLKVAGGISVSSAGSQDTSIGVGIAANVNVLLKDTTAQVKDGANITNTGALKVVANEKATAAPKESDFSNNAAYLAAKIKYDIENADDLVFSTAVAGAVVTGGQSDFTFTGAINVDVMDNNTRALIGKAGGALTTVNSGSVNVIANNYVMNNNIAGALKISAGQNSYGVGLGAVVEVALNETNAAINNAKIATGTGAVNVLANYNENLNFVAINGSVATGGGVNIGINGIVNVLLNSINAEIADSTITSGNLNIISNYDSTIYGATIVAGVAAGQGNPISGNIIANVLNNTNSAKLLNSSVDSNGKLVVKAESKEELDINSAAVSVSSSGTVAAAANIAATVLLNETTAEISNNKEIKATGVDVIATDNTFHKNRGGTLAATGGSAGVGGSILVDVYHKTVKALIGAGTKITSTNGDVKVSASAQNYFGPKNTMEIGTLDSLLNEIGTADLDKVVSLLNWQMTFDAAGGSSAGVSGSLITKVINNNVTASIGKNADITSRNLTVEASNDTAIRAIVGNLTGAGTAAVGGSFFVNVVTGTTEASISDGVKVKANGDVSVKATTEEDIRTIMVVGGGAGTVAVNGSANVNVFVNNTRAEIGAAEISANKLTVDAQEKIDIQSVNLAANGAGTVSVGAVAFVNTIVNNVDAEIAGATINTTGDVLVNAESKEAFGATFVVVSGSGTVAVAGLGVVNVISSNINAYVHDSNITSTNGKMDVKATHNFNEWKYNNKTVNIASEIKKLIDGADIDLNNYTPITTVVNIAGSGVVAVSGTVLVNTFDTDVHAVVEKSTISTLSGLNVNALSKELTYDILTAVSVSGCAAVSGTVITNVVYSDTSAELLNTTVSKGNVNVDAQQITNLNTILGGASGSAFAAVSAYVSSNIIVNNVKALIDKATILDSNSVIANAYNEVNMNTIGLGVAVVGTGAAVQGLVFTNVHSGDTEAAIKNSTIKRGTTKASAKNKIVVSNMLGSAAVSGVGADVTLNVATNVLTNNLDAHIDNTTIENNSSTTVSATSESNLDNYALVGGANGMGASLSANAFTNVVDNDVNAYIYADPTKETKITNGTVAITASQTTNLMGGIVAVNVGGVSVAGNGNAAINIFSDRVNAYSDNSIYTNVSALNVNAKSTETIKLVTVAVAAAGLGGISGSAIVNTISNDLQAYIKGGSITGGTITVASDQTVDINANTAGLTLGSVAMGAGAVVNVLSNTSNAYIDDTAIDNTGAISVSATSKETLINKDVNASLGGSAVGLSVVVNVIENETNAYVNAKNKSVKTTGDVTVAASDTIKIDNIAGSLAAGSGAGAGSANVNVINNAVSASLLSNASGSFEAKDIKVNATSDIKLDTKTASLAGGVVGIAGTASITSIGSRFSSTDKNSEYKSSETVTEAAKQANTNNKATTISYKDENGQTVNKSYTPSTVALTGDTPQMKGTVATVNANITTNNIAVNAINKLDFDVTNATAAIGLGAAGASVLVTDMNYNTVAQIAGGNINSVGNVTVNATTDVDAQTNADAAVAGGVAINGNVAYFKNKAKTTAQVANAKNLNAKNVSVIADSIDIINSKAISGTIGGAVANVSVSVAESQSNTKASVKDSNITNSGNTDVKASDTSTLTSEVLSATIGGIAAGVVVNNAYKYATIQALVEGNSNITSGGDFNLISSTGGLSTQITMYIGSLAYAGISVNATEAKVSGVFDSKILGTSKVKARNVTIKAGVAKNNNNNAGSATATISSKAATAGFYNVSATTQNATVNVDTNIVTDAGTTVEADSAMNILSALNRTATTGQSSVSLGALNIGALSLSSVIGGSSTIQTNGTLIANAIDINIKDTSIAQTQSIAASLTLISGSIVNILASVNQNDYITTNNLYANTIRITSDATKTATVKNASAGAALANIGVTTMKAEARGTSRVNMNGKVTGKTGGNASSLAVNVKDTSTATNESASFGISFAGVNSLTILSSVDSRIINNIGGDINVKDMSITNNLIRTAIANSAASSVSLLGISGMSLYSEIANGITANFTGKITGTSLSVNSNMTNNTSVDMKDNTVALGAFGKNGVRNAISNNVINAINFNSGSIFNLSGDLTAKADLTNVITMTGQTDSSGFISAKGSSLQNDITTKSEINFNSAKIKAKNMKVTAQNTTKSTKALKLSDSYRGFAAVGDAQINNNLTQTSNINISGNSDIYVDKDLTFDSITNTNFEQEVTVKSSGFTAFGEADSDLTVNNNNGFKISGNSKVHADRLTVNLDSSNNLTSSAKTSGSSFAGNPDVSSTLKLYIKNTVDVESGSELSAGNTASINFLKNSVNNLTQYAYVYAQAAVASANWAGNLTYDTNNQFNVNGRIVSLKDVLINYSNGRYNLSSTVAYKKVSRLLFGIPITSSGSSSRITLSNTNDLTLNGVIEAGAGNERTIVIDRNGEIDKSKTTGFKDTDYQVIETDDVQVLYDETVAEINAEITSLEEKIANLKNSTDAAELEALKKDYNNQITALKTYLTSLNNYMSSADAINTANGIVNSNVLNQMNSLAQSSDGYSMLGINPDLEWTDASLRSAIASRGYYQYTRDNNGNITGVVWKEYTSAQLDSLVSYARAQINAEKAKFTTGVNADTGGSEYVAYNGKIISDDIQGLKTETQNSINSLQAMVAALGSSTEDAIAKLNAEIIALKNQKDNLDFSGVSTNAILFSDIVAAPSKIEITGLDRLYGSGTFQLHGDSLTIDNYSDKSLVFGAINFANTAGGGLIINGVTKSVGQITGAPAVAGSTVKLQKTASKGIVINNWFDHNNPDAINKMLLQSNITFNGSILAGALNTFIWNESGDINFNSAVSATGKLDVVASQGNITYDSTGSDLTLKSNDRMVAGKNITIKARNIVNNGKIIAGNPDRTLIITDAMLNNLIVDPNTGLQNMINLNPTDKSAYMNGTNNIKALYVNGEILLFNTEVSGGNVTLTGNVSGSGSVTYTSGAGSVVIDNQTTKKLAVYGIDNKSEGGKLIGQGTIPSGNVTARGLAKGKTNINSVGAINILDRKLLGTQTSTNNIDVIGELKITSNDSLTFSGNVKNKSGNSTFTNNGSGNIVVKNGVTIDNSDGSITISSTNTGNGSGIDVSGIIINRNGNVDITNAGALGVSIAGEIRNLIAGNIIISNTKGGISVSGSVDNANGSTSLTNDGADGILVSGSVTNSGGNTTIANTQGGIELTTNGTITNQNGNVDITNAGALGINIVGKIKNLIAGNTTISNTKGGISVSGSVDNANGSTSLTNDGADGILVSGSVTNSGGNTTITNTQGGIELTTNGSITNQNGKVDITNSGARGINIAGKIKNLIAGNTTISNTKGGISVSGSVDNAKGSTSLTNDGADGILVSGSVTNSGGNLEVANNNTDNSKIEISGTVQNTGVNAASSKLDIVNKGGSGILISGHIINSLGKININNLNSGVNSQIHLTSSGTVTNTNGDIILSNVGRKGILIEGLVKALTSGNIDITNFDSDIVIGHATTDNNVYAQKGNIEITVTDGNLLNAGFDKTLISAADGDLTIKVTNGDIGKSSASNPGIGKDTRDFTKSINIKVDKGTITATATNSNNNKFGRVINLTSKNSDMRVNHIKADGDVMLTAADWKQADDPNAKDPYPSEAYFHGYSIINAAVDKTVANVEGNNISLVSSNNIGAKDNWLTYNQIDSANSWLSAEAENDLYLRGLSDDYDTNIWQLISKRGNLGLELPGDTIIREITAGKYLEIVNRGKKLTIYDLGKMTHLLDPDNDILYPHDLIKMGEVVPETIKLTVLDINARTRDAGDVDGNSILNIYNAYVRGQNKWDTINGVYQRLPDVTLIADTIIANAYDGPSSSVSTVARPHGFDATEGREYYDDPLNQTGILHKATGFNSVGKGKELVFDILGVSPGDVEAIGKNKNLRTYNEQKMIHTIKVFTNTLAVDVLNYKAKDVRLSINSTNEPNQENRGTIFNHLYADNAYIDTRDLNLNFRDAFITDYAEFRNGNRGGQGGYSGNYRWLTVVDNDFRRLIPSTLQLYTQLTGSFALDMGNLIILKTVAPVVHYNPYEVSNLPRTENSFTRLTYKDDKIQIDTTTPRFEDIDKDTYKPVARLNLRFTSNAVLGAENGVIKGILDISKGGLALEHDGSLKVGDKLAISLMQDDLTVDVEIQVVRISGNKAGVKFINMDKATANKILYLNMLISKQNESQSVSMK